MFKKIFIITVIFVFSFVTLGITGEINIKTAERVAQNWLYFCNKAYKSWSSDVPPEIIDKELIIYKNKVVGYNNFISE
ncbi:MAG: hypothetical protein JRI44_14045 [Deltaproteobacteria bacterium]|nr:hypothetical protein [Deltaproteobacteria bacterium]